MSAIYQILEPYDATSMNKQSRIVYQRKSNMLAFTGSTIWSMVMAAFVMECFLYWLEAMSLAGLMSESILMIYKLQSLLEVSFHST